MVFVPAITVSLYASCSCRSLSATDLLLQPQVSLTHRIALNSLMHRSSISPFFASLPPHTIAAAAAPQGPPDLHRHLELPVRRPRACRVQGRLLPTQGVLLLPPTLRAAPSPYDSMMLPCRALTGVIWTLRKPGHHVICWGGALLVCLFTSMFLQCSSMPLARCLVFSLKCWRTPASSHALAALILHPSMQTVTVCTYQSHVCSDAQDGGYKKQAAVGPGAAREAVTCHSTTTRRAQQLMTVALEPACD